MLGHGRRGVGRTVNDPGRSSALRPEPSPPAQGAGSAEAPFEHLIELDDVSVEFRSGRGLLSRRRPSITAVGHVSLSVNSGQTLGIVGATGSGKSTIAQLIMGMLEPTAGSVLVRGRDLSRINSGDREILRGTRQVVLQDPYSSLDPRMRVGAIIAEPVTLGRPWLRRSEAVKTRVAETLRLVGLPPMKADLYPSQFSGGQRQRIALARALISEPELIVLDEPTSALDVSVRAQILNLLKRLQRQLGLTFLVISHDLSTVTFLAETVAVMHRGRIVEIGPTMSVYNTPRHPYTIELLMSAPTADGAFLNVPPVPATESAVELPETACPYADRCAVRMALGNPARCIEESPALEIVDDDHRAACHYPRETERIAQDIRANEDTELNRPASATEHGETP